MYEVWTISSAYAFVIPEGIRGHYCVPLIKQGHAGAAARNVIFGACLCILVDVCNYLIVIADGNEKQWSSKVSPYLRETYCGGCSRWAR